MKLDKKFFITAAGITIVVLVLVLILSPKRKTTPATSTTPTRSALSDIVPINLSKEKRDSATIYTSSIESKLPLHLSGFTTSVDIVTAIDITHLDADPAEAVNLSIAGLSYISKEADESKNPNVTAFKESYGKAMEMLESQNIDPKKLIFIYGDKDYVRTTSQAWVDALKLHP
jgi:hypothetical protein